MSTDTSRSELAKAIYESTIKGARERNPHAAATLLQWIVDGLRKNRSLPPDWADFLCDSIELAISNPKHAGAAFGLVGARARPPMKGKSKRDAELVIRVALLQRKGVALKDGQIPDGAFTLTARECNTSKSTVERAWNDALKLARTLRNAATK